jgi:hypothetical protein
VISQRRPCSSARKVLLARTPLDHEGFFQQLAAERYSDFRSGVRAAAPANAGKPVNSTARGTVAPNLTRAASSFCIRMGPARFHIRDRV